MCWRHVLLLLLLLLLLLHFVNWSLAALHLLLLAGTCRRVALSRLIGGSGHTLARKALVKRAEQLGGSSLLAPDDFLEIC